MRRREFLKTALATAAVGAVAPKVLLDQPAAMGVDTSMNVYRLGVVGSQSVVARMNPASWTFDWQLVPLGTRRVRDAGFRFFDSGDTLLGAGGAIMPGEDITIVTNFPVDTKAQDELT